MKEWLQGKQIRSGQRKKPGVNNRGSSLVEVIVAMLVLAIIIVPMLNMFSQSAKTNHKARESQHENTVIENLVEELRAGNFTCYYDNGTPGSSDLREFATGKLCLYSSQSNDGVLSAKTFTTSVLQQGNKEYQANIRFEADSYRGSGTGLNDYHMPDINGYDTTTCEMVLLDGSSDGAVLDGLYGQYTQQEEMEYQQRLHAAWMNSPERLFRDDPEAWKAQWEAAGNEEPAEGYSPPPFDPSSVWRATVVSFEEFKNAVIRDTEITLEPQGGEYTVRYRVFYRVDTSRVNLGLEGGFNGYYDYSSGSGTAFSADMLKYIYVFYQPFTAELNQEKLVINAKDISLEEEWRCRMYLAVQGGPNGNALDVDLEVDNTLTPEERDERLRIQAKGGLQSNGFVPVPALVPTLAPQDKVYKVSVEVFEAGSDEILQTTETTLYLE